MARLVLRKSLLEILKQEYVGRVFKCQELEYTTTSIFYKDNPKTLFIQYRHINYIYSRTF